MKRIIICLLLLLITGSFILTGCKGTEAPEHSGTESSAPVKEAEGFNPDEPAPVPEGTPPYEEVK